MLPQLPWSQINTVLLDMDGTLLDLRFDNYFWLEHVPQLIAKQRNMSLQQAKTYMDAAYHEVMGTLNWYCMDYWRNTLRLDILAAKQPFTDLIVMRPDTLALLNALKASGRKRILATNAHPDALALKLQHTALDQHLDGMVSSHEFGASKEFQAFWQQLQQRLGFDPATTLFIDDNLTVLNAAREFGIAHLLAVANPDSQRPGRQLAGYQNIEDYRLIADQIRNQPFVAG